MMWHRDISGGAVLATIAIWVTFLASISCPLARAQSGSDPAGVTTGKLPAKWPHGASGCDGAEAFFIHAYNPDFYILRQSGCAHYEKPFLYLLFGRDRAVLFDTGTGDAPTRKAVEQLVATWLRRQGRTRSSLELIVTHTHTHPDHVGGDRQFHRRPNTTLVRADLGAVRRYFGFRNWPHDKTVLDLGGRVIDIIAIPGHDRAHIAAYDRQTGILLSGDSLYPGRIYVDLPISAFRASVSRLVAFLRDKPVTHVLGAHIEQRNEPFRDYAIRTRFQPNERRLELSRPHLIALRAAVSKKPIKLPVRLADLTVCPPYPGC